MSLGPATPPSPFYYPWPPLAEGSSFISHSTHLTSFAAPKSRGNTFAHTLPRAQTLHTQYTHAPQHNNRVRTVSYLFSPPQPSASSGTHTRATASSHPGPIPVRCTHTFLPISHFHIPRLTRSPSHALTAVCCRCWTLTYPCPYHSKDPCPYPYP